MIIALEGADAAGKATQAAILVDRLQDRTIYDTQSMSFPDYTTETGRVIRWMLVGELAFEGADVKKRVSALTLQALMSANRYEHFGALRDAERERALVLDRYWISGLAYGLADGLDRRWLLAIHEALPLAIHVLIDVPEDEALRRRPEARDRFERDHVKQQVVRVVYGDIFTKPENFGSRLIGRVRRVNGVGDVQAVADRIWDAVVDDL